MPRLSSKRSYKKSRPSLVLNAFLITAIGLTAIFFTYQGANTVQNLFSKASGRPRTVVQNWRFAGQGYGWNYICVDYRKETSSISLYEPNPTCPGPRVMEGNFDTAPIGMPVGNKYFTLEASLTKKSTSVRQGLLAAVLGESDENLSAFGKLMKKFQELFERRRSQIQTGTPSPTPQRVAAPAKSGQTTVPANGSTQAPQSSAVPTSVPQKSGLPSTSVTSSSTPTPPPPVNKPTNTENTTIYFSYTLEGRSNSEPSLPVILNRDGQSRKYEVRFPEIGEIRVSKLQLLLDNIIRENYELTVQSVALETDAPQQSPTPTLMSIPVQISSPTATPPSTAVSDDYYQECSDSDSGSNYYTYGYLGLKHTNPLNGSSITDKMYDSCVDSNVLWERVCKRQPQGSGVAPYVDIDGKRYHISDYMEVYKCPNGCKFDACISPNTSPTVYNETCTDTDGGKNYAAHGKVTASYYHPYYGRVITQDVEDTCRDARTLLESYCETSKSHDVGNWNADLYTCPQSCNNGACVDQPPPTATPTLKVEKTVDLVLDPPTMTVNNGQVFQLSIVVQAGSEKPDIAGASLNFNPSLLKVRQIIRGSTYTSLLANAYDNTRGTIDYHAGSLQGSVPTGTFVLAQIEFEAQAVTPGTPVTFETGTEYGVPGFPNGKVRDTDAVCCGGYTLLRQTRNATITVK